MESEYVRRGSYEYLTEAMDTSVPDEQYINWLFQRLNEGWRLETLEKIGPITCRAEWCKLKDSVSERRDFEAPHIWAG